MIQSAGVIIYNNKKEILGCIPFGKSNKLDIPKGCININEEPMDTVIRETYEETGIKLHSEQLKYLGKFDYINNNKQLYLFSAFEMFDMNKLYCISTFEFNGKQIPEMIGYKKINIKDIDLISKYFYYNLSKIIISIIKENKL